MFPPVKRYLIFHSAIISFIAGGAANAIQADSMSCGKMCLTKGDYKKAAQDFELVVHKSPEKL